MGHKSHQSPHTQNQRQLRVGEEIRHALSDILMRGELHDPELDTVPITVSEVRISPDLKNATVFVMPLGGSNKETVLAALNRAAQELRKHVTGRMLLRFSPKLSFRLDYSFEEANRIENLMRDPVVQRDVQRSAELTQSEARDSENDR